MTSLAPLTKAEAERVMRAAVVAKLAADAGYNPGKSYSKYGAWYGWPNALWCAAGCSWAFYQALGETMAKKVIGAESTAPYGRGYIWTVAFRQRLAAIGKKVALRNVRPGDLIFYKYPTSGDRNANVVNHVDLVVSNHASQGYIRVLGPNTPKPGTPGDPSNGRGLWYHNRSIYDAYVVDCWSANWGAALDDVVEVIYELTAPIIEALNTCGYPGTVAGVKAFQTDTGLVADGIPGPKTQERLKTSVTKIEKALAALAAEVAVIKKNTNRTRERDEHTITRLENLKIDVKALLSRPAATAPASGPSAAEVARAVWQYKNEGVSKHDAFYHLRAGVVDNPDHRAYPADADSLADVALRTLRAVEGTRNAPHAES